MIYAFSAARDIEGHDLKIIAGSLSLLDPVPTKVVTGGARGGDAYIAKVCAIVFPGAEQLLAVPEKWNLRVLDEVLAFLKAEGVPYDVEVVPGVVRDRNKRLVEYAKLGAMWAFPRYPELADESIRSGTWQTVRLARKAGVTPFVDTLRYPARWGETSSAS